MNHQITLRKITFGDQVMTIGFSIIVVNKYDQYSIQDLGLLFPRWLRVHKTIKHVDIKPIKNLEMIT